MDWHYKQFPVGFFDVIWASPPCETFSKMRHCHIGRKIKTIKSDSKAKTLITKKVLWQDMIETGLPPVYRTFEIIDYYKPSYYFLENPQTGHLKEFITNRPFIDVSYCRYGFPYRKDTRIWTNLSSNRFCGKLCNHTKPHSQIVGVNNTLTERYAIPPKLLKRLFEAINPSP